MRGRGLIRAIRGAIAGIALLLASCAGPGRPDIRNDIEASVAREIAAHPARYRFGDSRAILVSSDGIVHGLIWGTWHTSYNSATQLPGPILRELEQAVGLWVELDLAQEPPRALEALRQAREAAFAAADPAALVTLGPATLEALADAGVSRGEAASLSLPGLIQRVRDQALAPSLSTLALPQTGAVDEEIVGFARSLRIPVHSLERLRDQAALLYGEPDRKSEAAELRVLLRRRADLPAFYAWERRAYAAGRIAAIAAAFQRWRVPPADRAALARRRIHLSDSRNPAMAAKIGAALRRPGLHFIAIGAFHLLGDRGVPALLQQQGWTVTPCPADRC